MQRGGRSLDILLNDKGGAGGVGEVEGLRIVGPHVHGLRPGGLVDGIAGKGLDLRDHQCTHHAVDGDFTVFVGEIEAVAGNVTAGVGDIFAGGGRDLERHACQRFPGEGVPLVNDQCSGLAVFNHHRLRIAALPDDNIGAGGVHHIAGWGLDFRQNISAGGKVRDFDFPLCVRGENAVLGQAGRSDHTVQPHLTACGSCHSELGPGEGLAGGAVPFLDDNGPFWLVFEGQANRPALFDLDGLRLRIQNKSSGGAGLRHYHALARFQPGNADLAVFVRSENAVLIPDKGAVCIDNLELCVL